MLNLVAWIAVSVVGVYAAIGVVFALYFVVRPVGWLDPAARDGTIGFRLLILPGVAALWPLLMQRVRERAAPPEERNAHRDLARKAGDPEATAPVGGPEAG